MSDELLRNVPPNEPEYETAALGSALIDEAAADLLVAELKAADFYSSKKAVIFQAIVELRGRNEPANEVTVTRELREKGLLDSVGGAADVSSFTTAVASGSDADFYAKKLLEAAAARRAILGGAQGVAKLFEKGTPVPERLEQAERIFFEATRIDGRREPESLGQAYAKAFSALETRKRGGFQGVTYGFRRHGRSHWRHEEGRSGDRRCEAWAGKGAALGF